jgi:Nucleotidyl transferase AbiEii toxin, Type IV TA system
VVGRVIEVAEPRASVTGAKLGRPAMDFEKFLELLRALAREGVDYVLVGAVALNLHGIVRATEDVDLFIRPEDDNVERLKRALRSIWEDPDIAGITARDLAGEYPTIRYGPPGEGFVIDLLSRLGSAFTFEDLEVQTVSIEGVPVRVATPTTLYRMKKETIRPIDRADAAALREKFGIVDG